MSRKVKFSCNWKKEKSRVQKIHIHIGNARRDFLHKTSTSIKVGSSSVATCITNWRGKATGSLPARRRTQVGPVHAAVIRPPRRQG